MTATVPRHPGWAGSIRFRLTVLYSVLLFGLAAIVVGGIYAGVARSIENQDVSRTEMATVLFPNPRGSGVVGLSGEVEFLDELAVFEREVDTQTLEQLRTYAFGALGLLFVGSLAVGWFVAGLVLRPVGRITGVARDIQATDLARRIQLEGPDDELKQLADTFDSMLGRLDEAFAAQRHFIHEASHELRNPLAVIRTNVDVALADPDAGTEDLRAAAEAVGRSAERMSTLVDDLLVYARHGTRPAREEELDLVPLVADLVEEFEASAESRGIRLESTADSEAITVCVDGPAVRRAVANLVANAVRLAPAESTITVRTSGTSDHVSVSVADEGPGIAADDHGRVFQRFWRGSGGRAGNDGRSGLGLTIVRQIAESHGGRIELDSDAGRGSTFTLRLPRIPAGGV